MEDVSCLRREMSEFTIRVHLLRGAPVGLHLITVRPWRASINRSQAGRTSFSVRQPIKQSQVGRDGEVNSPTHLKCSGQKSSDTACREGNVSSMCMDTDCLSYIAYSSQAFLQRPAAISEVNSAYARLYLYTFGKHT